jgi:hypothetical protein
VDISISNTLQYGSNPPNFLLEMRMVSEDRNRRPKQIKINQSIHHHSLLGTQKSAAFFSPQRRLPSLLFTSIIQEKRAIEFSVSLRLQSTMMLHKLFWIAIQLVVIAGQNSYLYLTAEEEHPVQEYTGKEGRFMDSTRPRVVEFYSPSCVS